MSESKNESMEWGESKTDFESFVTTMKSLETSDLYKVIKQAITEIEKRSKTPKTAKRGSMPKGKVPVQLVKPRAWVDFTLKHAQEHGWEAFMVHQSKKDKDTGEKVSEEIEMPGSILHNGVHVFEGSVTEKVPNGKQLIHKDAMSLSKQRWVRKEGTGTHRELYEEFEASYVDDTSSENSESSVKTDKNKEKEEKKLAKEKEKEEKKLAKEKEKEEKKLAKEREKEAKVPAKAVKAPKAAKEPEAKEPKASKAKEPKAPKEPEAKEPEAKAPKAPEPKAPEPKAPKVLVEIPDDGMVHPWPFKGKQYLRNSDNQVWARAADGGCGDWQGVYLPASDKIDSTATEPEFEDE